MKNKIRIALTILAIALFVGDGFHAIPLLTAPSHAASTSTLSGTIEVLNFKENTITILDYDGRTHVIKVPSNTRLEIEGIKKGLEDFYFGQEVDIEYNSKEIIKIKGFVEEDPDRDGYIMAGNRFKRGEVLFISKTTIELKTRTGREKYRITPNTGYEKRSRGINLNQIKEGDKVLLTFDSIYTSEVATVKIEDEEQTITGVIRGKIELVDERNKEILVKMPYIYKEGTWIPPTTYAMKLKTSGDNLYNRGQKITLKALQALKGSEVYIAYDENLGRMNIAKLTVKNGLAQGYQSKVSNIQYNSGQMIVDNNLVHFNAGTIVIKDNRIVDPLNINRNNDVIATIDNIMGTKNTALVYMTTNILENRTDETKMAIYRGKIEDIYDYGIKIGKLSHKLNYLELQDQKWVEIEESQRLDISDDTLIYDSDLKEIIEPAYFISSRFINLTDIKNQALRNRLKNNYYKNKDAYFIVREDENGKELLAINLVPYKQSYGQNVKLNYATQGEIKSIDYDKGTITLTAVKNYNTLNNRWEKSGDETVNINKSVVLLNDIPLPLDRMYNLRQGAKIYTIKEKTSSIDESYILFVED